MSSLTPILQKYIDSNGLITIAAPETIYNRWDHKLHSFKPFRFIDVDRIVNNPGSVPINTKFIFLCSIASHAAFTRLRNFAINRGITIKFASGPEIRDELLEVLRQTIILDTVEVIKEDKPKLQEIEMRAPKRGELKRVIINNPGMDVERITQVLRTMGITTTEGSIKQAIGKYRRRGLVSKEVVKSAESKPAAEASVSQDDMDKLVSDIKAGIDLLAERARDNSGLRDKLKKLLGE